VRRLSIRWRLTLWYGTVLSILLFGFSAAVYLLMERHLLTLTDAALSEELAELAAEVRRVKDVATLPRALEVQFPGQEGYELQVRSDIGQPLFRSQGVKSTGLPGPHVRSDGSYIPTYESIVLDQSRPARMASCKVAGPSGTLELQAAVTLVPNAQALKELVTVLLTLGPLALASAAGGGYWLARRALAPVDRMAATAAEITAKRLDRRLAEPEANDELGYLARTFNTMISRLERSFDEVRRFTADAAHELRTPLAAMRTEAEVALRSERTPDRDAKVLENLLEEIDRLTRLVGQLLFLCREDTGLGAGMFQPLRLDKLVHDVGDHMQVLAREKGVDLRIDIADTCEINGDPDRLRQLFFNLLYNAIKYTRPDGSIIVIGDTSHGQVRVTVTDTGIGIPAEHLPRVFERFYRVDPSRSVEIDGNGLGLSICCSIAESHAGRLSIESVVDFGTRVTLALPALREDVAPRKLKDRTPIMGHDEPNVGLYDKARTRSDADKPALLSASLLL
jgi:two-component system, OmpR family, heavy metal sensor histidine kinase CusS